VPRRRCVGCGRIALKSELLRIAVACSQRAVIDLAGTLPGRGAYLCRAGSSYQPNPDCLRRAERRRGIARALRRPVTLDLEPVESTTRVAQPAAGGRAEPLVFQTKRVAQPAEGRRAEPLAISKS
jgi:predicted RNA-binding protein YlxR (DUF448 family)